MNAQDSVDAMMAALFRLDVEVREECLSADVCVSGGLCRLHGAWVVFVAPDAPPWARAAVLVDALKALVSKEQRAQDMWLPPAIRALIEAPTQKPAKMPAKSQKMGKVLPFRSRVSETAKTAKTAHGSPCFKKESR